MAKKLKSKHKKKNGSFNEKEPPTLHMKFEYDSLLDVIEQQLTDCAWGVNARHNPVRAELVKHLLKMDFNPMIIHRIADALSSDKLEIQAAWTHALSLLANELPIYKEDITAVGGTIALLGATGVGKTSTIGKLAARYALKNSRDSVAIVTTDGHRIAANEQLKVIGGILGVPVTVARSTRDLLDALNEYSDREFVLIDTAGMGPKDLMSSGYLNLFSGAITQIKNFLVLPATTQRSALEAGVRAYRHFKLDGSIITKTDETTSLGGVLSAVIVNRLPVAYYSDGQRIPDDFHLARAHNLVSKAVIVADSFMQGEEEESQDTNQDGMITNASI